MAENTPKRRASYEAAATTPRLPSPPTTTGLPTNSGRRSSSTATKNMSMSTCAMVRVDSPVCISTMCTTIRQLRCCRVHYSRFRTPAISIAINSRPSNRIRWHPHFRIRRRRNGLPHGGCAVFRLVRRSNRNWNVHWIIHWRFRNERCCSTCIARNWRMARACR